MARWNTWRIDQESTNDETTESLAALRESADQTRDRLLAWRELLGESRYLVDEMSTEIADTQAEVRSLRELQVTHQQVEDVIRRSEAATLELQARADKRLDELAERLGEHAGDTQLLIKDLEKQTGVQLQQHGHNVSKLLEQHLNPVNSYLNTMHVRNDGMRSDIEILRRQVTDLSSSVGGLSERLAHTDERFRERALGVDTRIGTFEQTASQERREGAAQLEALRDSLERLSESLELRLSQLDAAHGSSAETLQGAREEVAALQRDLSSLEQKVAKWVHATPLPNKISEARLYSLEARLQEEMQCRLLLEEQVKHPDFGSHGLTISTGRMGYHHNGVHLPSMQRHIGTAGSGSNGSARKVSARRSVDNFTSPVDLSVAGHHSLQVGEVSA